MKQALQRRPSQIANKLRMRFHCQSDSRLYTAIQRNRWPSRKLEPAAVISSKDRLGPVSPRRSPISSRFCGPWQEGAFRCEKRAAIDVVYSRLKQCGLDRLCSIVHDSQSDKKEFVMDLKATYELFSGTWMKRQVHPIHFRVKDQIESISEAIQPLQRFEEAMETSIASSSGMIRMSIRELIDRCIEARSRFPTVDKGELSELACDSNCGGTTIRTLRKLRSLIDLQCSGGVFSRHPLRLVASSIFKENTNSLQLQTSIEQLVVRLEQLESGIQATGIPVEQWNTFAKVDQLLTYMERVAPSRTTKIFNSWIQVHNDLQHLIFASEKRSSFTRNGNRTSRQSSMESKALCQRDRGLPLRR